MVDLGLFKLLPPESKDEQNWTKWAKPVVWSRRPLYHHINAPCASEDEVYAAISIAKTLFRGPWSLPVAAMLLGLKPRQRNDPLVRDGFIEGFGANVIRNTVSQGLKIDGERLPEVQQYRYIIDDIASDVLDNDESASSDTDSSTDGNTTSVDDLAATMNTQLALNSKEG